MNFFEIHCFIPKLALVAVGMVIAECARQSFNFFQNKRSKQKIIREVICFPDKKIACKDFFDTVEGCSRKRCEYSHEQTGFRYYVSIILGDDLENNNYITRNLLSYIKSAKKSIDICVYCISCFEIADVVLERHKVGVRVRVITDLSMEIAHGSQNPRFMKDGMLTATECKAFINSFLFEIIGIRVQVNKPPFLMHHKFFIIDDELICCGSFNWTSQAVTGNNESVIVTNDSWAVQPFVTEFKKLWLETKP